MKPKTKDTIELILAGVCAAAMVYILISYFNVLATRPNVPSWNFFKVITAHGESQEAERHSVIAEHERQKGQLKIKYKQKYEYTPDNVWYLSHVIAAEVGADWTSDEAVFYVGSVVLNRVESSEFPDTIKEVVLQPGQYATVPYLSQYEPSERVMEITSDLLNGGSVLPSEVIYQANFKQGCGVYLYVDRLYFCY